MNPRNFWYIVVKKMIMSIDELYANNSPKADEYLRAIEKAKEVTARLNNGDLRLRAVEEVLIKKCTTSTALALELHYEETTVIRWISDFVNLTGLIYGFNDREN